MSQVNGHSLQEQVLATCALVFAAPLLLVKGVAPTMRTKAAALVTAVQAQLRIKLHFRNCLTETLRASGTTVQKPFS